MTNSLGLCTPWPKGRSISVPVRLLHRDDRTVVIAGDGQLHADDQVALNQAYKLHLALKMQMAGGGGGHHHGHEH